MGDWGRERGGDVGASTEDLEAGRCRVALAEMTDASERALPAVVADTEIGTLSLTPLSLTPARYDRRQCSTEPLPKPAVAAAASRAAIDATPVCRERARVREIEDGVCGAHRGNALDHSCRCRASRPCCLAKID